MCGIKGTPFSYLPSCMHHDDLSECWWKKSLKIPQRKYM